MSLACRPAALALTASCVVGTRAALAQRALAITDVTVVDGTGSPGRAHMTVLIDSGRIVAVETADRARVPRNANVMIGTGKFLIPGLWDMHVHLAKAGEKALGLFVANGVTSVRDMGGDFALIQRWRSDIEAGTRVGPRIRTAGPILESAARVRRMKSRGTVEPVDRFRAPIADTIDARRVVDSVAHLGVDFVKVRTVASADVYRAIAAEARRVGLTMAAHGDIVASEAMIDAGQRSIEHAIYPSLQKRSASQRAAIIQRLRTARTAVVPTMVVYYQWRLVAPKDASRIVDDSLARIDPRRRSISGYLLSDWREQVAERDGITDVLVRRFYLPRTYAGVLRDLQEMHRAGVPILAGTDVAVALVYPGSSLHDELRYFVDKVGMTPSDALRAATHDAAVFSGMLDSVGTVTVGKRADLVLLDADPLADIRNISHIAAVWTGGRLLDRNSIGRLLATAR